MLTSLVRAFSISALALSLAIPAGASAAEVIAIGDSLTAEYDTIPSIPGFPAEATAYADVTRPGWVSMSWVEVAARLQRSHFNFGGERSLSRSWGVPRLSGFEYNWAVPGIMASQYEDFVTSSAVRNFAYFSLRQPLESQLRNPADRVVIWLGANEFRANYGRLYDGGNSKTLVDNLVGDLGRIVDFVRRRNSRVQIVIANVPDIGASPSKIQAHPDPMKRARVTAAVRAANSRIAGLASGKGIGLANVYALTDSLVRNVPLFIGPVQIVNDEHPENHPRYAFTRDGLHPNTCLQIFNARAITAAFNQRYRAGIPGISDAAALTLLGINQHQPFYEWLAAYGVSDQSFIADRDGDGVTQLIEYAFKLDPTAPDAEAIDVTIGGPVAGIVGPRSVVVKPDPARTRHVTVAVQYSVNGTTWLNLSPRNVVRHANGAFTAVVPPTSAPAQLRLRVATIPPSGSTASVASVLRFE